MAGRMRRPWFRRGRQYRPVGRWNSSVLPRATGGCWLTSPSRPVGGIVDARPTCIRSTRPGQYRISEAARRADLGANQDRGRTQLSWGKDTARALSESASERRPGCPKANRVCTARTSHPIPRNSVSTCFTCIRRSSQSRNGGIATPYPRRRCSYDQHLARRPVDARHRVLGRGSKRGRGDANDAPILGIVQRAFSGRRILSWANLAGGTGSNRRPCGFQPGATCPDPSGTIRFSRIRPDQQGSRSIGHPA
jgi:hypothetical protein